MPSPFPGMDPYLEGPLWPDVHHTLATEIRQLLAPRIRPKYMARIEITVLRDETPGDEVEIYMPDVDILLSRPQARQPQPTSPGVEGRGAADIISPATLTIPLPSAVEVRVPSIQIRDTERNLLITSIEILSPANKREPHLTEYREKRRRLHLAGVHLLEIDLLRRGTRPLLHPNLEGVAYLISLTRAKSAVAEGWPLGLRDPLPTVPVPLREPDGDIPLPLQEVLNAIYDRAGYDLSIDYRQPPPPPPLSEGDRMWMRNFAP